jgi:hypothetical protein
MEKKYICKVISIFSRTFAPSFIKKYEQKTQFDDVCFFGRGI